MHRHLTAAVRRTAVSLGLLVALALSPLPVLAHAELTASSPEEGQAVQGPPTEITLDFSGGLRSNSHFEVRTPQGEIAAEGAPDPATATRMVADGSSLTPGRYAVEWTSVSTDGDVLRGRFVFTVTAATPPPATASPTAVPSETASATSQPTPSASPSPAGTPTPSAPPDGTPTAGTGDVVLPILVALIVIGGLGLWLARRQRRV